MTSSRINKKGIFQSELDTLLHKFNKIDTWTKEKKNLKSLIIEQIKQDNLSIFIGSKHIYKLSRFGQTRKLKKPKVMFPENSLFENKEVELLCMGKQHCDFIFIAVSEIKKSKSTD